MRGENYQYFIFYERIKELIGFFTKILVKFPYCAEIRSCGWCIRWACEIIQKRNF